MADDDKPETVNLGVDAKEREKRGITVYDREPPYTNPPPGFGAYPQANPVTGETVFRGYIKEIQTKTGVDSPDISNLYRLNFHFNPMSVRETWSMNPSAISPVNLSSEDVAVGFGTNSIVWSFSLIFDRIGNTTTTFSSNMKRPGNRPIGPGSPSAIEIEHDGGVLEDLRILQKLATAGRGGPGASINALYFTPVQVVLGSRSREYTNAVGQTKQSTTTQWKFPLTITGFINSYDVTYTRFNALMTPVQAYVNLSIRVWEYLPENAEPKFPNLTQGPDNPFTTSGVKAQYGNVDEG